MQWFREKWSAGLLAYFMPGLVILDVYLPAIFSEGIRAARTDLDKEAVSTI